MGTKKDQELEIILKSLKIKYKELMREVTYLSKQIELKRKKRDLEKRKKGKYRSSKARLADIDAKTKGARIIIAQNLKTLKTMKSMHKKNIIRLKEMISRIQYIEMMMSRAEGGNINQGTASNPALKSIKPKKGAGKKKGAGGQKISESRKEKVENKDLKNSPGMIQSFKTELKNMLTEISMMRKKRNDILKDADNLKSKEIL
jgi:hypothetical protein